MSTVPKTATVIWRRILKPGRADLPPDLARYILEIDFTSHDVKRMARLSLRAEEGKLSRAERAELEEYLRVADTIALMQSKARRSLKRHGRAS